MSENKFVAKVQYLLNRFVGTLSKGLCNDYIQYSLCI